MSIFHRTPALRWALPVVAALVLTGGGATLHTISAAAQSGLPERSAAQLLVDVQTATVKGLSGTLVQTADLGLPGLAALSGDGSGGNGSSNLTSLVAGSHTLRVWYAGPKQQRLALVGSGGESDIIRNGADLWTWSSQKKAATHLALPATSGGPDGQADATPTPSSMTPQQIAQAALTAISPSTKVSTTSNVQVAGRQAYDLVLQPRDTDSLVGSVQIAIDGATHIPTRVQVFAKGASHPAFQVGFTSFDPTTPDPSVFAFNPPPDTKVTQKSLPDLSGSSTGPLAGAGAGSMMGSMQAPQAVGKGWTTVLLGSLPPTSTDGSGGSGGSGGEMQTLLG
ncbi:MAG: LolA family protein, partial [Nocardioidaceae bacterium]